MHRFFVEGSHEIGENVPLHGSDAHKLVHVLRLRTGVEIEIVDSTAARFRAVARINGRDADVTLLERLKTITAQALRVTVAQGIPKGQKMDFVVEKLTELGAASIIPLQSERTVATHVPPHKLERWRRLAKTAAQQCGRAEIPSIEEPQTLTALARRFDAYDVVLLPWELASHEGLRETLPAVVQDAATALIAIGPEGGFSHAEAEAAANAGARLISLGRRILRTETAALVLLSILAYVKNDI